jgi:hypothetical protein
MEEIAYTYVKDKAKFSKLIKAWFLRERGENVRVSLSRTIGVRKGGYIYEYEPQLYSTIVLMCKVRSDTALWLAAFDFKSNDIVESVLWLKKKNTQQNNVMAGRFSSPVHWKRSN